MKKINILIVCLLLISLYKNYSYRKLIRDEIETLELAAEIIGEQDQKLNDCKEVLAEARDLIEACEKTLYPPKIVKVSYYADAFHGKIMANGKKFDMRKISFAHKTLPLGTKIKVTNLENGKYVVGQVTDRGPYIRGRTVDASYAAAKALDMVKPGVIVARLEVVG